MRIQRIWTTRIPGQTTLIRQETAGMPATRKYDDETRARVVRMYADRLRDRGES